MEEQNNNNYAPNGNGVNNTPENSGVNNVNGAENSNGVYYQPNVQQGAYQQQYSQQSNPQSNMQGGYYPPNQQGNFPPQPNMQGYYQQPPMPPQPPKKKNKALKIIGIIVGVIVLIFVALFIYGLTLDESEYLTETVPNSQSDDGGSQTQEETQAEPSKEIVAGTFENGVYSNEFAGFSFTVPDDDWTFSTNDQIYEMLEGSNPQKADDGRVYIETEAEKAYYDAMILNGVTGTNIQVMLSETDNFAGVITSEDMYIANATAGLADSTTNVSDTYDLTIAGETYKAVDVDYTDYGTIQTIAARKIGGDFVCVIITVYTGLDMNGCDYYTNLFKPL